MDSKSTKQQIIIPPAIIKDAINNKVSLNESGLIVVIPAEASLKHYDLLTLYWKGKEGINKSYPKAITQQREGKNFTYQIPLKRLDNSPSLDIWYSFYQAGTTDIKTSPVTTVNIILPENRLKSINTRNLAIMMQSVTVLTTEKSMRLFMLKYILLLGSDA